MRLNVVVAVSENWGIGKGGGLPWKIKKDMEFFKTVTTKAHPGKVFSLKINPGLKNAVVMGRVTWESIPESFKPLKDRINIVVSSTLSHAPSFVQIVPSFNAAIDLLYNEEFSSIVDEVFIIGGYRLYKEALKQSIYPVRIYCTHILSEVDCDTYFPKVDWDKLKKVDLPDIPADTFTENGFTFKFCVYDVPSEQFI
uniref:dihydrofolate reductase n=1 Tax=Schistosoma mansoni TaxID=6183 RepID=A0A3Q0KTT7_SCHMA